MSGQIFDVLQENSVIISPHGTEHENCEGTERPHGINDILHMYHGCPYGTEHPLHFVLTFQFCIPSLPPPKKKTTRNMFDRLLLRFQYTKAAGWWLI